MKNKYSSHSEQYQIAVQMMQKVIEQMSSSSSLLLLSIPSQSQFTNMFSTSLHLFNRAPDSDSLDCPQTVEACTR